MISYKVLDIEYARTHAEDIVRLLDHIPGVAKHTIQGVLAEEKKGIPLIAKWERSMIMLLDEELIGVIIAYERRSEHNTQYPYDSIYLNSLAIDAKHQSQGYGRGFIQAFLTHNDAIAGRSFTGSPRYTVQTNSADWNRRVIQFYESCGFVPYATKQYDDRIDVVMTLQRAG